jgi:PAS domain S-box-containing protein
LLTLISVLLAMIKLHLIFAGSSLVFFKKFSSTPLWAKILLPISISASAAVVLADHDPRLTTIALLLINGTALASLYRFVLRPLNRLAAEIQSNKTLVPQDLRHYAHDELGRLARMIHQQRQQMLSLNHQLQAIGQNLPGIVYRSFADRNRSFFYLSAACEKITGYPANDFVYNKRRQWQDIIHPEDTAVVQAMMAEQLANGATYDLQYRVMRSDGKVLTVNDRGCQVQDKKGRPVYYDGVVLDITDSVQLMATREDLQDHEQITTHLFEHSGDGIWIWDIESDGVVFSKEWWLMVGYRDGELPNHIDSWRRLINPAQLPEVEAHIRRCITGELEKFEAEFQVRHKDGSFLWVLSRGSLVKSTAGKPERFIGSHTNITQLKKSTAAAEAANIAKSAFLANMSHEIRTPINAIMGTAELLLDSPLDNSQREHAEMMLSACENLLVLVNDVLDLAKVEAGRMALEAVPFDLLKLIHDNVKLFYQPANSKGLDLLVDYDWRQFPERVVGDPTRLRQILSNLLSNAIKFTAAGYVRVEVKLQQQKLHHKMILRVVDSGIGIPEKMRARIFEKFTQADASTTRQFGGTGLGLAICQQLAKLMNGTITCAPNLPTGTCFEVALQLGIQEDADKRPLLPLTHPSSEALPGSSKKILLLEPSPDYHGMITRWLTTSGYQTETIALKNLATASLPPIDQAEVANDSQPILLLGPSLNSTDRMKVLRHITKQQPQLCQQLVVIASEDDKILQRWISEQANHVATDLAAFPAPQILRCDVPLFPLKLIKTLTTLNSATGWHAKTDEPVDQQATVGNTKVLVAEDALFNQKIIEQFLRSLGCQVVLANDGVEALSKAADPSIELILMDCQMPIMDGYQSAAAIMAQQKAGIYRTVPIIALTAHAMVGDREKCLASGMVDYLTKPLKKNTLKLVLEQYVKLTA